MYINIGRNTLLPNEEIIMILDLDNSSQSHITREFLANAERAGLIKNAAEDELPKAVVVTGRAVYLSQLASSTLLKRWDEGFYGLQQ